MVPPETALRTTGAALVNPFLARELAHVTLGGWPLDARTLNLLEKKIAELRPKAILEFGSGVSTACLAHFMRELRGASERIYVFSIEESEDHLERTWDLVSRLGLNSYVSIEHRPVCFQRISGRETVCYDLPANFVASFLGETRPDFVLIDGPSGGGDVRFGTLPLMQPFLSSPGHFFLDDGLRDDELRVCRLWKAEAGIAVEGIYVVGEGLLQGRVR